MITAQAVTEASVTDGDVLAVIGRCDQDPTGRINISEALEKVKALGDAQISVPRARPAVDDTAAAPFTPTLIETPVLAAVAARSHHRALDHADDTGYGYLREKAAIAARECRTEFASGNGSWRLILREKFCSALAQSDPAALRRHLLQVAATAVMWAEAIDRRGGE